MRQSTFPFASDAGAEGRSLLKVLDQHRSGEDRAQRGFRQLVASIERRRNELAHWQDYAQRYDRRVAGEIEPLRRKLVDEQRQMALLIDELLTQPTHGRSLGRKYHDRLRKLLIVLLEGPLDGDETESLSPLREKYRDREAEAEQRMAMELTRGLLEGLGVELEEGRDARSPEELMEFAYQQMHERYQQDREAERRRRACGEKSAHSRPNSSKAQAAEAQREHAARAVRQSLRDVYRKLASALHPDREPDSEERRRKNTLMQEANRAYEANDLLALLDLQLRIEQISGAQLSSLAPQRLALYKQILREQLAQLEAELARFTAPFRMIVAEAGGSLTTANVDRQIDLELAQMRRILRQLQEDMVAFRDPVQLRRKLDECEEEDDFAFTFDDLDDFDELADLMRAAQTPRRGRSSRRRAGKSRRPVRAGR